MEPLDRLDLRILTLIQEDAGLSNAMGWVVRRTMIRVDRPCRLNERLRLTTFCTGAGRSWAERRTTISGTGEGADVAVEAVSLWVQVDVVSGRPTRLGTDFFDLYGTAAAGRTVSSKLSLPGPPEDAGVLPWKFRETDIDLFDHVNNAAQWAVAETLLAERGRLGTSELEYALSQSGCRLLTGVGCDLFGQEESANKCFRSHGCTHALIGPIRCQSKTNTTTARI